MRLSVNVLLVRNSVAKRTESELYNDYLKKYSVIDGVMCATGDCLVVVVMDSVQIQSVDTTNFELLSSLEYAAKNVDFLCETIHVIAHNYNVYCANNNIDNSSNINNK
ncbi:ORF_32 [Catopsilia pomona nucleopolyhedrovirus]|uniref:ORF_32 n=1 Tax=Catopsilia pomona nucleopolyhedrovirus TaxID=1850906 RepID=A0A172WZA6_9ABAC|nr:ORF_32 [Catopsilia pomona nucleopolyhedrovirus]ANF29680.1 ORF_32 [Catopsilia pomona nucleopolyhedrovirus]